MRDIESLRLAYAFIVLFLVINGLKLYFAARKAMRAKREAKEKEALVQAMDSPKATKKRYR